MPAAEVNGGQDYFATVGWWRSTSWNLFFFFLFFHPHFGFFFDYKWLQWDEKNLTAKSWMWWWVNSGNLRRDAGWGRQEVTRWKTEMKVVRSWEREWKIHLFTAWRNNTPEMSGWGNCSAAQTLTFVFFGFCQHCVVGQRFPEIKTNGCIPEAKSSPIMTLNFYKVPNKGKKRIDWLKYIATYLFFIRLIYPTLIEIKYALLIG